MEASGQAPSVQLYPRRSPPPVTPTPNESDWVVPRAGVEVSDTICSYTVSYGVVMVQTVQVPSQLILLVTSISLLQSPTVALLYRCHCLSTFTVLIPKLINLSS
jgi:hypothetical protein